MEKLIQFRADEEFLKRLELQSDKAGTDKSKYIRGLVMSQPLEEPLLEAEEGLREKIPDVITAITKVLTIKIERQKEAEINQILADTSAKQNEVMSLANRIKIFCRQKNGNKGELRNDLIRLRNLIPLGDKDSAYIISELLKVLEPEKQTELKCNDEDNTGVNTNGA